MRVDVSRLRRSKVRILLVVALAVLGATGAAMTIGKSVDESESFSIVAEFVDASPLVVGSQVKRDGVVVGTVVDIAARDGKAAVTLSLNRSVHPLHRDARATIRPVTLLGERFVDLEQGTSSAPLVRPGSVLPSTQTRQATDLDEVLNTVDDPTGESLAALVTMLGQGMQNRGQDARAAIAVLESAMRDTGGLVKVLGEHSDLLVDLVSKAQPVADALAADEGKALDRLLESTQRVLTSTAQNDAALDAVLAELPTTVAEAQKSLTQLTGASDATTPVLAGMRPATSNLSSISRELHEFSKTADPALATAEPVLKHAEKLLTQAQPVVAALRDAGSDLKGSARAAKPIVTQLTANVDNVLNFFRYWAMATNGWDGLSHYFRGMVIINPEQITGLLPGTGGSQPEAPAPAVTLPGKEAASGTGLPSGLLDDAEPQSKSGGVTGLDPQQESNALKFLLGGS